MNGLSKKILICLSILQLYIISFAATATRENLKNQIQRIKIKKVVTPSKNSGQRESSSNDKAPKVSDKNKDRDKNNRLIDGNRDRDRNQLDKPRLDDRQAPPRR